MIENDLAAGRRVAVSFFRIVFLGRSAFFFSSMRARRFV
jgi:hypothetical protein